MTKQLLGFISGTLAHPLKFSIPRFVFLFDRGWIGTALIRLTPNDDGREFVSARRGARRERRVGCVIPSNCRRRRRRYELEGEEEEEKRERERGRETRHVVS